MAVLDTKTPPSAATGLDRHAVKVGPIGRLGRYTATHFRVVLIAWLLVRRMRSHREPRRRRAT